MKPAVLNELNYLAPNVNHSTKTLRHMFKDVYRALQELGEIHNDE